MTIAVALGELTVAERFRGPEGRANGGWIAGTLASGLVRPQGTAVEVTLRAGTPLDVPLTVATAEGEARLTRDGELLVEAKVVESAPVPPPFVSVVRAARAEEGYAGRAEEGYAGRAVHPYPGCFVCGLREPGSGMRIFPGPVAGTDLIAACWMVSPSVTTESGEVPEAAIWAALDCPSGWVHLQEGRTALLGRLTAQVHRPVYPGGTYVVVARSGGGEGRKLYGESALYEGNGTLIASARATWIATDRS
ncbi:hypothetical protein [Rhizohabitans arisaemae]|uniref:hypothetical protein n=1 Tax=Rhizohabitans arisaemae TaxID=2720610 RepID=UPI0024B09ED1|nr:hypothetical protein [Rhizohabitans arisaemae]